jgi:hypothetical protein
MDATLFRSQSKTIVGGRLGPQPSCYVTPSYRSNTVTHSFGIAFADVISW